jgi:hypothetical protein
MPRKGERPAPPYGAPQESWHHIPRNASDPALSQLLPRTRHRIINGGIDLVLHRTVACPTGCHESLPSED